ncbi:MAG TPA: hypothetical protein VGI70_16725, partial [Polyangiales bacterium]
MRAERKLGLAPLVARFAEREIELAPSARLDLRALELIHTRGFELGNFTTLSRLALAAQRELTLNALLLGASTRAFTLEPR